LFPVAGSKCILGYRLARVRTSLLWCILRKVGGSSHIRFFLPCFARGELWIGTCTRAATDDVSQVHENTSTEKYAQECILRTAQVSTVSTLSWLFHSFHLLSATPVSLIVSFPAPALSHSCLVTVSCPTPVSPPIYRASISLVSCWIVVRSSLFLGLLVPRGFCAKLSSVTRVYSWPACSDLRLSACPFLDLFAFWNLLPQRVFCYSHWVRSCFSASLNKVLVLPKCNHRWDSGCKSRSIVSKSNTFSVNPPPRQPIYDLCIEKMDNVFIIESTNWVVSM